MTRRVLSLHPARNSRACHSMPCTARDVENKAPSTPSQWIQNVVAQAGQKLALSRFPRSPHLTAGVLLDLLGLQANRLVVHKDALPLVRLGLPPPPNLAGKLFDQLLI